MKQRLKGAGRAILDAAKSKKGRKLEAALIAYIVAELQRKGYLPLFPLPNA